MRAHTIVTRFLFIRLYIYIYSFFSLFDSRHVLQLANIFVALLLASVRCFETGAESEKLDDQIRELAGARERQASYRHAYTHTRAYPLVCTKPINIGVNVAGECRLIAISIFWYDTIDEFSWFFSLSLFSAVLNRYSHGWKPVATNYEDYS